MAAVRQDYLTRTPPHIHIVPPAPDQAARDVAEVEGRELLRMWSGRDVAPERPLSADEYEAVALLLAVLDHGQWTGTWSDLSFGVDPDLAQKLVDDFAGDTVRGLGLLGPGQVLELFGQGVYLGPERLLFLQAQLANQRAVRAQLARKPNPTTAIDLHFTPAENTLVDSIYEQRPGLIEGWATNAPSTGLTREAFEEVRLGDYLRSRPGRWNIAISPPLRAPIELPQDPREQPQGWRLDIPDRVREGLDQLERAERPAVLSALWAVQRQGERGLGDQVERVESTPLLLYVLHPTPEICVILQRQAEAEARLVEIVRAKTLQMFRER